MQQQQQVAGQPGPVMMPAGYSLDAAQPRSQAHFVQHQQQGGEQQSASRPTQHDSRRPPGGEVVGVGPINRQGDEQADQE